MLSQIADNPESTCFLVEVISKKSQNTRWEVTVEKQKMSKENIRKMSIDKFYELVTGDKFAFKKLCEALPKVIDDIVKNKEFKKTSNTVYKELIESSPNIMKTIFLTSFKTYNGFEDISINENNV